MQGMGRLTRESAVKGVVFLGGRELELREFPDPTPGPGEVVLEIKASGMCGSDLKFYRAPKGRAPRPARSRRAGGPIIAGHEPCGVVARSGRASPRSRRAWGSA